MPRQANIGDRVCYRVPERGGWGYSYGNVLKVNRKSYLVSDCKQQCEARVDKALVYQVLAPSQLTDLTLQV